MKDKKPKISVVMVNFNGKQYLVRTIHLFLRENYFNYELILADNMLTEGVLKNHCVRKIINKF